MRPRGMVQNAEDIAQLVSERKKAARDQDLYAVLGVRSGARTS